MSKESGGNGIEHNRKLQVLLAIGLIGLATMLANRAVDFGAEFQIPWSNVHVSVGAGIGPKEKLTDRLPAWEQGKLGPNANKSDIINLDPGMNLGDFGMFALFDIRNAAGDPPFDLGIAPSN